MKAFKLAFLSLLFISFSAFAQETIEVTSSIVDIGQVHETLGSGTRRLVLKLNPSSPQEFKLKFHYKYRFVSQEIETVHINAGGFAGYSTRSVVENFDGDEKIRFDIAESTVTQGESLELIVEISKPNKNIHGIKVAVRLAESKGNIVHGGKKFLGLLGRAYEVKADCP